MSAPASPAPAKGGPIKKRWWLALGGSTLWISILIHVLVGVGAAYIVVEHFQKKHINFHATEPPAPHNEVEHKVELAKKNNVESAPPDLRRITTTDLSPISLPDVPVTPPTDDATPTDMAGSGDVGEGMGSGVGGGGGGAGGGTPAFGADDGSGLKGFLYDLKQTPDRKPTGLKYDDYYQILEKYLNQNWHDTMLDKYFKSKKPLYASRFVIKFQSSADAPKAFHVENEVQPSYWAVAYHGKVTAPTGDYQFVGFADNVLVVRIDGKLVLDAGWNLLTKTDELHQDSPLLWCGACNGKFGKHYLLKKGLIFQMRAGAPVDMDVLIGDDGGECAFFLQVRKVDNPFGATPDDPSDIPFFQLDDNAAP